MPTVTDPGGGTNATGPVQLGAVVFTWGPYRVQRQRQPNVYRQQGINAWLLNDYGWNPTTYTLECYATDDTPAHFPDPSVVAQIAQQFAQPTAVVPLLVPYLGIADTVRLVRMTDETDSTKGPGEVTFVLELEECAGQVTTVQQTQTGT